MTRQDIEIELQVALNAIKGMGMIDRPALDFIKEAVAEKLARKEECLAVKRKDYLEALNERSQRLSNKDLGHFVKATLWTALEKK